jgi:hypothetical protein
VPHTAPYAEFTGTRSAHYVAAPHTATIVNLAIRLGRPLLVEGEAGCGKTRLASAIAEELGIGLTVMTVKSTSQAKDLLYRFDALRRLQDAQDPANSAARQVHPYIDLEPLGHAIREGQPQVVLIDEVDKADIDFPNDLLDVLDRFEFDIEDLPRAEDEACAAARGFGRHVTGARGRPAPHRAHHQQPGEAAPRALPAPLPVCAAGLPRRQPGHARRHRAQEPGRPPRPDR